MSSFYQFYTLPMAANKLAAFLSRLVVINILAEIPVAVVEIHVADFCYVVPLSVKNLMNTQLIDLFRT